MRQEKFEAESRTWTYLENPFPSYNFITRITTRFIHRRIWFLTNSHCFTCHKHSKNLKKLSFHWFLLVKYPLAILHVLPTINFILPHPTNLLCFHGGGRNALKKLYFKINKFLKWPKARKLSSDAPKISILTRKKHPRKSEFFHKVAFPSFLWFRFSGMKTSVVGWDPEFGKLSHCPTPFSSETWKPSYNRV